MEAIAKLKKVMGRRFFAAILTKKGGLPSQAPTKSALMRIYKGLNRPKKMTPKRVKEVQEHLNDALGARLRGRVTKHHPYYPSRRGIRGRVADRRVALIRSALDLRYGDSLTVRFGDSDVGVSQEDHLDWDYYAKSCKYPKKVVSTTIRACARWYSDVYKRGLACIGGMPTLAAHECNTWDKDESPRKLFFCTWVVQGRGNGVSAKTGYIAKLGDLHYHHADWRKALAGLDRKIKAQSLMAALINIGKLSKQIIKQKILPPIGATVTLGDARRAGACDSGVQAWINKNGVLGDSIPMTQFLRLAGPGSRDELGVLTAAIMRQHRLFL